MIIKPSSAHRNNSPAPLPLTSRLLILSILLLPFSTGTDFVVLTFAVPFLVAFTLLAGGSVFFGEVKLSTWLLPIVIASALCVLWMAVTAFWAEDLARSYARIVFHFSGFLILMHFAGRVCGQPPAVAAREYRALSMSLAWSGVILSTYYIGNFVFQSLEHGIEAVLSERWVGGLASLPWGASNTIASALLITLLPALDNAVQANSVKRVVEDARLRALRSSIPVIIILGIAFTQSRNSLIIAACLLIVTLVQRLAVGLTVLAFLALGTVLLVQYGQDLVGVLLENRIYSDDLITLNKRTTIWDQYLEYIAASPFSFVGYYGSLAAFEISAHNFSLNTYVEQGPIGWALAIVIFTLACYWSFQLARSKDRETSTRGRIYFAGWVLIAINLHFEDANYTQQYILYFWTLLALLCGNVAFAQRNKSDGLIASPQQVRHA